MYPSLAHALLSKSRPASKTIVERSIICLSLAGEEARGAARSVERIGRSRSLWGWDRTQSYRIEIFPVFNCSDSRYFVKSPRSHVRQKPTTWTWTTSVSVLLISIAKSWSVESIRLWSWSWMTEKRTRAAARHDESRVASRLGWLTVVLGEARQTSSWNRGAGHHEERA